MTANAHGRLLPGRLARIHLITDLFLLWIALGLATFGRLEPGHIAGGDWIRMGLVASAVWILAGLLLRYYGDGPVRSLVEDAAMVSLLVGLCVLVLSGVRLLVPNPAALPGAEVFLIASWSLAMGFRLILFRPLQARLGPEDELLIIGVGSLARATVRYLCDKSPRRRIVGHVMPAEDRIPEGLRRPLVGRLENLVGILDRHPVDEVYIAIDPGSCPDEVKSAVNACERIGLPFALPIPSIPLERSRPRESSGQANPDGYIHFCPVPLRPHQAAFKRIFDICASASALVLLSPLLLFVAVTIKLSSPGAVLFRQERVGLHGRRFGMLKFRSMYADAEARRAALESANEQEGPIFKIKNDPRITPIGRIIRKFSIDELPQLINVLRGEMSVVGPRPPLSAEVDRYEPWQRRRLSVPPGLTCIWQVSGRNEIGFEEWMLLDMRYIDHWGVGSDLGLILRTIPVVVTGRGAS